MNIFVCIGLNIHWTKMAFWHKGLKTATGVQNNTGNFEYEQAVIVFKITWVFLPLPPPPPRLFFFPLW